jgi:hypothetical protein
LWKVASAKEGQVGTALAFAVVLVLREDEEE